MQVLLPLVHLLLALGASLPLPLGGDPPVGPQDGVFLLRDVQVLAADGTLRPGRSLLLRDGRIAATGGPELAAPAGARVLAGGGRWVVQPGLVHARLQQTEPPATPFANESPDARRGPIPEMSWGTRKDLHAWLRIADVLEWDPGSGESWRKAGFTSGIVLPGAGILRGHTAWIALDDQPLGDALLQRDGVQVAALSTQPGGWPRTPMAALAALRQAFLDADRRARLRAAGLAARHPDPDLEALLSETDRPLLFLADREREIENALDLVRSHAAGRRLIVLGGRDAWKLADRLRDEGASVLYVLDLPDAPKTDEELGLAPPEERPWWQPPARLREERRRVHAERVAGFRRLREAGVACALVPGGTPKDLAEDLEQLVDDGLDPATLLTAMSRDVARILGLPDAGRIEPGGAADLLVTRGPWAPGSDGIAWVFADGRGWEFPEAAEEEEEGASGATAPEAEALAGTWEFPLQIPGMMEEPEDFVLVVDTAHGSVEIGPAAAGSDLLECSGVRFAAGIVRFVVEPPDMGITVQGSLEAEGDAGEVLLRSPLGDLTASATRRGGGEEAEPGAAAGPGEPEQEAATGFHPSGHPEWPVETRADRLPGLELHGSVLLRGGTLHTMTGRRPAPGDLLIRDGRIAAVGGRITAAPGIPVLDVAGMHVVPGVIDPHSHLALDSINEGSVSISAECRIGDMLRPEDPGIYRAAAGGTAIAQALHGSANPIGGQAAVWELDVNRRHIAELLLPGAPQGIKFALGENVKQSNSPRGGNRFPTSRPGVEAVYRRAFTRAREYAAARRRYDAGEEPAFRRDLRLEALAGILEGRIHVQCHSYRADEILMFLRVCRDFGIQAPTFQHVLEGYKVAPELAAYGAMASTFSDWWAYKIEAYDAIPWNPALMTRAGVVATINSDSSEMIRRLNTEAGKSLRYGGLDEEQALALCTRNAALQLHLGNRLGTLEEGKDGTVTVFDGPPLSTFSRCRATLARGRALFLHDPEHDRLWADYARAVAAFAEATRNEETRRQAAATSDLAWERWTRPGRGRATLILDAVVHPVSSPAFEGAVLVADGRIAWTGTAWDGPPPAGCTVVHAGGMHLYPGFLDCGDRVGLYEIGSVRGTLDDREVGDWQPDLSVASALHADSAHIAVQRMNGVTHVLAHGSAGTATGQAALMALAGETSEELAVVPDLGLHLRFPSVARPEEGKAPEDPDALEELDRRFDEAIAYGEMLGRLGASPPPARDLKKEALLPYASGEKPLLLECLDFRTLARAAQWVEERHLQAVFLAGRDAWKVAGLLGRLHARVIVGPVHSLPATANDPYDAPYRQPGVLDAAGCLVGLRTENPEVTRNLPFQAATAAAHGWDHDRALYALTLGAARVVGVDAYTGSIEVGKAANLFLSEGDPLDFPGRVRRLWIGGREVPLTSRQTELRDRYAARIDRWLAARRKPVLR